MFASNAGLALAATAATLVPRFWTLCLPAMTLLCAGFTWAAWRLYYHLFDQDDAAIVAWLNAFQFPLLIGSLLVIRSGGYRLTQIRVRVEAPGTDR